MCNTTVFSTLLDVASWHRSISFFDYQVKTGHSKVEPNKVQRRKVPVCSATWFWVGLMINEYYFNTKFLKSRTHRKLAQVYESKKWPGFRWVFRWSGGIPNVSKCWCNSSIMFFEFILSNNSSFEPEQYLENSYIPTFAMMHTLKL